MARVLVEQRLMSARGSRSRRCGCSSRGCTKKANPSRGARSGWGQSGSHSPFAHSGLPHDLPRSIAGSPARCPVACPIPVEMNLESKTALEFLTTGEGTWAPGLPNFVNPRWSRACWQSAWRRIRPSPNRRRRGRLEARRRRFRERRHHRRRGGRADRRGRRRGGRRHDGRAQPQEEARRSPSARPKRRCSRARSSTLNSTR